MQIIILLTVPFLAVFHEDFVITYLILSVGVHLIVVTQAQVHGLPDMSTQSLRAAGPRAKGGHIGQTTSDCVTTIM